MHAPVVAQKELGELLAEVEDDVSVPVLARNGVGPEILHENDLVGDLLRSTRKLHVCIGIYKRCARRRLTCSELVMQCTAQGQGESHHSPPPVGPCLLDPVGQVPDKVKEEILFRNTDSFIRDLDKEAKALSGFEVERLSYVLSKPFALIKESTSDPRGSDG